MQIERFLSPSHVSPPAPQGSNISGYAVTSDSSQGVPKKSSATTWRELCPELDRWSSRLATEPEVRPDVVAAARLQLSSGAVLTRRAAEQTAAAIVGKE